MLGQARLVDRALPALLLQHETELVDNPVTVTQQLHIKRQVGQSLPRNNPDIRNKKDLMEATNLLIRI